MTGTILLIGVLVAYYLVYLFFMKRTDNFMDKLDKELKEEVAKAKKEAIEPLVEAAASIGPSLQKAIDTFKTSHMKLEALVSEIEEQQKGEKIAEKVAEKLSPFREHFAEVYNRTYPDQDKVFPLDTNKEIYDWKTALIVEKMKPATIAKAS